MSTQEKGIQISRDFSLRHRVDDFIVSYFLIGPLVVSTWYGGWSLMDYLIQIDDEVKAIIVALCIGGSICACACLFQTPLENLSKRMGRYLRLVFMRLYAYIFLIGCINLWRGVWYFCNYFFGLTNKNLGISLATAAAALLLLRNYSATVAPPMIVVFDIKHSLFFKCSTHAETRSGSVYYVFDSVFSVLGIGSLCVCMWRGVWELLNVNLYPNNQHNSAIYSLIISYSLAFLLVPALPLLKKFSICIDSKVHPLFRLGFEDVIFSICMFICVNHWRGYWMLIDIYIWEPPWKFILAHGVGYFGLTCLLVSTSAIFRGCPKDFGLPPGQNLIFDSFYVTNIIQYYRSWKQKKKSSLILTSRLQAILEKSTKGILDDKMVESVYKQEINTNEPQIIENGLLQTRKINEE